MQYLKDEIFKAHVKKPGGVYTPSGHFNQQ